MVPVKFAIGKHPSSMTIAFFYPNYTAHDIAGLNRIISVYRINGPAIQESISGTITSFNGLAQKTFSTNLPDENFKSDWTSTGSFDYSIDASKIYENPPPNIFASGTTNQAYKAGAPFGAGITISSFLYNIFDSSTLSIGTNIQCSSFGYRYTNDNTQL